MTELLWECNKCKKDFDRNHLTEIFGWGYYICESCIHKWMEEGEIKTDE